MTEPLSKPPSRLVIAGIIILGTTVAGIVMNLVCTQIAGRSISPGVFIGPVSTAFGFSLLLFLLGNPSSGETIPKPHLSLLTSALDEAGIRNIRLVYAGRGEVSKFPRILAVGRAITVPKRVLDEMSSDALVWSIKTDAYASQRSVMKSFVWLFAFLFALILLVALGDRFDVNPNFDFLLIPLVIGAFILLGLFCYKHQLIADKHFTVTDRDRLAAKEALSFPYFAQNERPWFNKWLFFSGELSGRAKRLGIVLEKGFKAP